MQGGDLEWWRVPEAGEVVQFVGTAGLAPGALFDSKSECTTLESLFN